MSALIVIPARLGSSRLPNKPLRDLGGRPLIVRVWERIESLRLGADVVVATDSDDVVAAVQAGGGRAVITSTDHPSGTDRVAEVAGMAEYRRHDVIVNVQGDEPFVSRRVVEAALAVVESGGFAIGTAASPDDPAILASPNVVKVVRDATGRALYFSRAPIPYLRADGDASLRDGLVLRHVGVYAYRADALRAWVALPPDPLERVEQLEQLRPLAAGMPIGVAVVDEPPASGIDTAEDLARANAIWAGTPAPASSPVHAGTR